MVNEEKFLFQFVVAQVGGARADLAIDSVRLHKANCNKLCPAGKKVRILIKVESKKLLF